LNFGISHETPGPAAGDGKEGGFGANATGIL